MQEKLLNYEHEIWFFEGQEPLYITTEKNTLQEVIKTLDELDIPSEEIESIKTTKEYYYARKMEY